MTGRSDDADGRSDDEPPEWARERARELVDADPESDSADDGDRAPDVPVDVVDEAERLTRLAREASDPGAADLYRERRDELVTDHDYEPRLREEDDTLVLYPDEWVEDGTVRLDRVEDTDRAVEVSLSGPGDADRYREVAAYNEAVAEAVADAAAEVHGANARRFAEFMSNHYVREVDDAPPDALEAFREDYFPRNAWPTDEQRAALDESLSLVEEVAADVSIEDVDPERE